LVTGGGSGIGFAIPKALLAEGASVCLADIRPAHQAAASLGDLAFAVAGDVADEAGVGTIVNATHEKRENLGPRDIVENSAGIMSEKRPQDMSVAEFDREFAVNVRGTFLITREALPFLRIGSVPRIINIASELVAMCKSGASAYAGTKGAIIALTRSWSRELAPEILVNVIAPGPTDTPLLRRMATKSFEEIERSSPLGRVAQPADAAVWLAGNGCTFVTGQTTGVTGGTAMFQSV
jgi:3-oxoacyl-[acyl-carrier protein] reductase